MKFISNKSTWTVQTSAKANLVRSGRGQPKHLEKEMGQRALGKKGRLCPMVSLGRVLISLTWALSA